MIWYIASAMALEQDRDSDRSDTIIEDGHVSFVLVGFPFGLKLPEKGQKKYYLMIHYLRILLFAIGLNPPCCQPG